MSIKENSKSRVPQRRPRRRFLEVDVWRSRFGPMSVKAIYDVYSTKFNTEIYYKNQKTFTNCVNALRKLDNPDYISPDYGSRI